VVDPWFQLDFNFKTLKSHKPEEFSMWTTCKVRSQKCQKGVNFLLRVVLHTDMIQNLLREQDWRLYGIVIKDYGRRMKQRTFPGNLKKAQY